MKIATITMSLSRAAGGLFESVRRLHLELNNSPGTEIDVLGLTDEYTTIDQKAWLPIRPKSFPIVGPKIFGYSPAMAKYLFEKSKPEILHQHGIWMYPAALALKYQRHMRIPLIISPHGMLDPWAMKNSIWKKRLANFLYQRENLERATCLRALCVSEAQSMRAIGLKNPICIIPNGIDIPEITNASSVPAEEHPIHHIAQGRKILLYLGRIHPKKGLINLLRAWRKTTSSHPAAIDLLLVIAGWDQNGHEAELKQICRDLGICYSDIRDSDAEHNRPDPIHQSASVIFAGPQFNSSKAAYYRSCSAFILPSVSEGLPMVILESWAYGKPVIMTPQCNLPEGFTANAAVRIEANAESIAEGMKLILSEQPESLLSMGNNGFKLVKTKFSWNTIGRQTIELNNWLVGGGTKPENLFE